MSGDKKFIVSVFTNIIFVRFDIESGKVGKHKLMLIIIIGQLLHVCNICWL